VMSRTCIRQAIRGNGGKAAQLALHINVGASLKSCDMR
jgi:hypothetical protein